MLGNVLWNGVPGTRFVLEEGSIVSVPFSVDQIEGERVTIGRERQERSPKLFGGDTRARNSCSY